MFWLVLCWFNVAISMLSIHVLSVPELVPTWILYLTSSYTKLGAPAAICSKCCIGAKKKLRTHRICCKKIIQNILENSGLLEMKNQIVLVVTMKEGDAEDDTAGEDTLFL